LRWTAASAVRYSAPSSYFMKSPPQQFTDDEARELVEAFIRGDAAGQGAATGRPTAAVTPSVHARRRSKIA
jgi:myo-inositol-1-phosphate synthase